MFGPMPISMVLSFGIEKVATDDNVADNPSRANYPSMVYIGAK